MSGLNIYLISVFDYDAEDLSNVIQILNTCRNIGGLYVKKIPWNLLVVHWLTQISTKRRNVV